MIILMNNDIIINICQSRYRNMNRYNILYSIDLKTILHYLLCACKRKKNMGKWGPFWYTVGVKWIILTDELKLIQ